MDKLVLKFFADILYLKGLLCSEELEAIMDVTKPSDLDVIFEKMFRGGYNVYKRGEPYTDYAASGGTE
jgi:hypothetical protein